MTKRLCTSKLSVKLIGHASAVADNSTSTGRNCIGIFALHLNLMLFNICNVVYFSC